jgi:two-component system, LuxR family, response regulator FixJ
MMSQENRLVYIVDDDEAVRDSIRVLLQSHDIETRGCRSADEFLLANPTDMVCLVLDLHMPGTSGLDLLRLLRVLGLPVPIIVISGRLDATLDAEVRAAGVTAMLSKPFDDEALLAVVQAAVAAG